MKKKQSLVKKIIRDCFELVKLNLIFFVCCLPVLSIPAAIQAMTNRSIALLGEEGTETVTDFLHDFRQEFLTSLKYGLLIAAASLFFGYVYWFYQTAELEVNSFVTLIRTATLLPLLLIYCASCYLWPMNRMVELPFFTKIKNAVFLTVACVKETLICLLAGVFFTLIGITAVPYSTPFLIVIAFALWNYVCTAFTAPAIRKHILRSDGSA